MTSSLSLKNRIELNLMEIYQGNGLQNIVYLPVYREIGILLIFELPETHFADSLLFDFSFAIDAIPPSGLHDFMIV